jgi:hypothetical protein
MATGGGTAASAGTTAAAGAGTTAAGGGIGPAAIVLEAFGAAADIAQAIRQRKLERDRMNAASAAVAQAKKALEVNRMEGLQVPLSAYEMQMTGITQQQKQGVQALIEADSRTTAAGIGKITGAAGLQNEKVRQGMEQALFERDKLIAQEQAKIDAALATINLEEAAGAQQAAAEAAEASALAATGAVEGLGSAGLKYFQGQDLFGREGRVNELAAAQMLQSQGKIDADLNKRQARREMLAQGYTPEQIADILSGNATSGPSVSSGNSGGGNSGGGNSGSGNKPLKIFKSFKDFVKDKAGPAIGDAAEDTYDFLFKDEVPDFLNNTLFPAVGGAAEDAFDFMKKLFKKRP